jgi:hypothetical protein
MKRRKYDQEFNQMVVELIFCGLCPPKFVSFYKMQSPPSLKLRRAKVEIGRIELPTL